MALTLSKHQGRTRTVDVIFPDYRDDPDKVLHVTYRPRGFEEFFRRNQENERYWRRRDRDIDRQYTDELDREDARADTNDERDRAFAGVLLPIIADMDLYLDDSHLEKAPIDEDTLIALGAPSLIVIINAIVEEMQPKKDESPASNVPSLPNSATRTDEPPRILTPVT